MPRAEDFHEEWGKDMSEDFHSARHWAAEKMKTALYTGAVCVDATMGNGHDTLFLAQSVGAEGRVYAFDVQPQALENTRARLAEAGCLDRARLILAGHENMGEYVKESVDLIAFNLGWLPGMAERVTTQPETTLKAVNAGLALLKETGLMTICIYPGHEAGKVERDRLLEWASNLDAGKYDCLYQTYLNQPNSPPSLLCVRKRPQKA